MRGSKGLVLAGLILATLVLAGSAWAMDSAHYRLDWFVPLTGTGGAATSTHYAAGYTVGQSVSGRFIGAEEGACLGFWCAEATHRLFLPVVLRNHS